MAARNEESGVSAGVLVVRETSDGARFLLVRDGDHWCLPVAEAGNADDAVGKALRKARELCGLTGIALNQPPVWFATASEPAGHGSAGRDTAGGGRESVRRDLRIDPPSQHGSARYRLATAAGSDDRGSESQDDIARWTDLDQALQLTPRELHGPLAQAAALLMKIATLVR